MIQPRASWNATYYGRPVTPQEIVHDPLVDNPHADNLRRGLAAF